MTHLDSLVSSTRDQSRARLVKGRTEDTLRITSHQLMFPLFDRSTYRFRIQTTTLRNIIQVLERFTRLVIPEGQRSVVT
jgi:hypothetical protein